VTQKRFFSGFCQHKHTWGVSEREREEREEREENI